MAAINVAIMNSGRLRNAGNYGIMELSTTKP